MKEYNYILFDWDGNIAQTLNLWPDAIDVVLQKKGISLRRDQLIKACSGVAKFLAATVGMPEEEGKKVLEEANKVVESRLSDVELYPDVTDVLRELYSQGKKLALITSSVRKVVMPLVDKFELSELFDVVVCAEDTNHLKPDPEPIYIAMEAIGGVKEQSIMIGDTPKDINAAKNAGIDSLLFYPDEHKDIHNLKEFLKHEPTYVVNGFQDAFKIISGLDLS